MIQQQGFPFPALVTKHSHYRFSPQIDQNVLKAYTVYFFLRKYIFDPIYAKL